MWAPRERSVGTCRVRFSHRQGVLIVEPLDPLVATDLPRLSRSFADELSAAGAERVLLDLRPRSLGVEADRGFRDALTGWAIAELVPLMLVVDDEMHLAEINMASLGSGGHVRAFASTADAFRYALRVGSGEDATRAQARRSQLFPRRASEVAVPIARRGSSAPPPRESGVGLPRRALVGAPEAEQERPTGESVRPPARASGVLPYRDRAKPLDDDDGDLGQGGGR